MLNQRWNFCKQWIGDGENGFVQAVTDRERGKIGELVDRMARNSNGLSGQSDLAGNLAGRDLAPQQAGGSIGRELIRSNNQEAKFAAGSNTDYSVRLNHGLFII